MAYYGAQPTPAAQDPGRTLGIVGLVLAFFCNLVGLVISIIAYNRSKAAGFNNGIAKAGIIVGAVLTAIGLLVSISRLVTAN